MMQILLPICRKALFDNVSLIQSTAAAATSYVACFRSTPTSFDKWKYKWDNQSDVQEQRPSKTHIRYVTRQKRAYAKKALNDLLFRSGSSKFSLEEEFLKGGRIKRQDLHQTYQSSNTAKKEPLKASARHGSKAGNKKKKRKTRREEFFEDDPGTQHFQAVFGNKWYTWAFKSPEESFSQRSAAGFEWRENSYGTNNSDKWKTASDVDSDDDESSVIGSVSDRITLGLPLNGPLEIDVVKNAFRLSALKWHPDKHQGPSQAMAEEKFKLCASAYKSLCEALYRAS